ncbi:MAG: hypothetical protein IPL20_16765 [Saprospiraceae bacterium]|nr:hypothetical protein [Saprospiraceae bacterium]
MSPDSVKKIIFFFLFLLSAFYMKAQILIPWLGSNGTYGFADENGKVVFRTKIDQPLRVFSKTDVAHPITLGGTTIHLLRNGTIVKFALYAGQVDWITPEGKSKILPNLAFVDFGLKMELVHLKSGVKKIIFIREILPNRNGSRCITSIAIWSMIHPVSSTMEHIGYIKIRKRSTLWILHCMKFFNRILLSAQLQGMGILFWLIKNISWV